MSGAEAVGQELRAHWCRRRSSAARSSLSKASRSVRPTTGMTPGSTVTSSAERPNAGRQRLERRRRLGLGLLEVLHHGEDDIGGARGQPHGRRRAAGLQHHRPALRRAADVERALHLEPLAVMVERAHLGGVDIEAAGAVGDDRVVGPAVPQALDHVDEFLGDLVA